MIMHVTTCITNCAKDCYEDKDNEVHGACGPLLIHTHSTTKTKEKYKAEQLRQSMDEAPMPALVARRFVEGIDVCPAQLVDTSLDL
jgi:hypothetical protein